jgi:hypothetical protein
MEPKTLPVSGPQPAAQQQQRDQMRSASKSPGTYVKVDLKDALRAAIATSGHASTEELGAFLANSVHGILKTSFHAEGIDVSEWLDPEVIVEPSLDKARSGLTALMARTKSNLVATISKNDKVENAVALIDWRSLEVLCTLARKGLETKLMFAEFAPSDAFSPDEAQELSRIEIHRPLPNRQSVGNRRMMLRKFSSEGVQSERTKERQTPLEM